MKASFQNHNNVRNTPTQRRDKLARFFHRSIRSCCLLQVPVLGEISKIRLLAHWRGEPGRKRSYRIAAGYGYDTYVRKGCTHRPRTGKQSVLLQASGLRMSSRYIPMCSLERPTRSAQTRASRCTLLALRNGSRRWDDVGWVYSTMSLRNRCRISVADAFRTRPE